MRRRLPIVAFFIGGSLKEIVERVLAPLVGSRMWGFGREADVLIVQLGARQDDDGATVGAYTLRIACAWRVAGPTALLVASGDLFTPADVNADLETFDWDVRGASWWDVRMDVTMPIHMHVSEQVGVPDIDGDGAATALVDAKVRLGLRTSTRSEYAPPSGHVAAFASR